MKKTIIVAACAFSISGALQASVPEGTISLPEIKTASVLTPSEPCAGNSTVKFNFKHDATMFSPAQVTILAPGKQPMYLKCNVTDTSKMAGLADGKYDFVVTYYVADTRFQYQGIQNNIYHPAYFVVKENVQISGNTELTFDVAEAKNFVEFKAMTPDGKPYQHPVSRKQSNGTRELDYTDANIHFETIGHVVYHKYYGMFDGTYMATTHVTDEGESIPGSFNYYINDVSDNYRSTMNRLAVSDKGEVYIVTMAAKGVPGKAVTNTGFKKVEEKFVHTPVAEYMTRENGSRIEVWGYVQDLPNIKLDNTLKAKDPTFYYSASEGDAVSEADFRFQIRLRSFEQDQAIEGSDQREQVAMVAPIVNITEKGISYENLQNEYFTFPHDNFSGSMGDNVPLTMMVMHSVDVSGNRSVQYMPSVFGRYGEQIQSSASSLEAKISHEGKTVFQAPIAAVNNWAVTFAGDGHQKGKVTGEFTNYNVKVDGIPGKSTLKVNYDENRNDVCAPTAQMLMFTDAQNMPKSKFSAADQINVRIAGGDPNGNGRTYSYMDAHTISFAYAPYATDNYANVDLSFIRRATSSQSMAVYGATLPAISEKSSNGWYDVKISLSDNEGNTSEQIISPAFYIEGNAGIDDIEASQEQPLSYREGMLFVADGAKVEIYSLDGRKVMEAASPVVTLDALPAGLYIARTATATLKIMK